MIKESSLNNQEQSNKTSFFYGPIYEQHFWKFFTDCQEVWF